MSDIFFLLLFETQHFNLIFSPIIISDSEIARSETGLDIRIPENFSPDDSDETAIRSAIERTLEEKASLLSQLDDSSGLFEASLWSAPEEEFDAAAKTVGVLSTTDVNIRSLRELITYGLKGMAAYLKHASALHAEDESIDAFLQQTLAATLDDGLSADDLIFAAMETGKYGVNTMALLDQANTGTYGNPEISEVRLGTGSRPRILVSGHDLKDLEMLLEQTQGTGIDVYTHSEMLPAHYYPAFKKYSHLAGNYGNAWWKQKEEFEAFNRSDSHDDKLHRSSEGQLYRPPVYYRSGRLSGMPSYPGRIRRTERFHSSDRARETLRASEGTGTGKNHPADSLTARFWLLPVRSREAVRSGAIRKFVVMAGCDGRAKSREYYTEFAEALPKDTVILTAGCAKYKYNKLDLGDIGGIPRVLDAGQCNDCYSLAVIALKLKEVFGLEDINDLPIIYNIAWYEQKAVLVLLALLSLGVKNIHLGPTLPAFLSPDVADFLVKPSALRESPLWKRI